MDGQVATATKPIDELDGREVPEIDYHQMGRQPGGCMTAYALTAAAVAAWLARARRGRPPATPRHAYLMWPR
jgi:hypothetical protein